MTNLRDLFGVDVVGGASNSGGGGGYAKSDPEVEECCAKVGKSYNNCAKSRALDGCASFVKAGRKLTPCRRSKTDPPGGVAVCGAEASP
jgi:hypothetical protein